MLSFAIQTKFHVFGKAYGGYKEENENWWFWAMGLEEQGCFVLSRKDSFLVEESSLIPASIRKTADQTGGLKEPSWSFLSPILWGISTGVLYQICPLEVRYFVNFVC
ncbi:UNVERIFIED_CONTAM: hypothetical protein K2H54_014207 [Gekko kuhli]